MRTEQDVHGEGLYTVAEARRLALRMASALFSSAPSRASVTAARSLARGRVPARRVFRVSRGNAGFRVGAWAGDGSVAVMTRQRRRKALRVEAKASRRERMKVLAGEQAELERLRYEREVSTVRGAIDSAVRSMDEGGLA